jgi:hypothetical protein
VNIEEGSICKLLEPWCSATTRSVTKQIKKEEDSSQDSSEEIKKRLSKEEWNRLLTFAYHKYLQYDFNVPYRTTLFNGTVEDWIDNCRQIQYGDRLSVIKSAFNCHFHLKLTNKDVPRRINDLLNMI